jgi:ABC-2 type transport system ATP-binding protein
MTQKAQVIAATLHDPDLLIVDEPFANLDPVNIELVKGILLDLKARGKGVIMSSHQLALVEALCDRIVLINKGERLIYGTVREVKQQFAANEILVAGQGNFAQVAGVTSVTHVNNDRVYRLGLDSNLTAAEMFRRLAAQPNLQVERFEVALPSLEEVFLRAVAAHGHA